MIWQQTKSHEDMAQLSVMFAWNYMFADLYNIYIICDYSSTRLPFAVPFTERNQTAPGLRLPSPDLMGTEPCDTVVRWNPAPTGMYKTPVNNGINYQPQLVQNFSHQQYCYIAFFKAWDNS